MPVYIYYINNNRGESRPRFGDRGYSAAAAGRAKEKLRERNSSRIELRCFQAANTFVVVHFLAAIAALLSIIAGRSPSSGGRVASPSTSRFPPAQPHCPSEPQSRRGAAAPLRGWPASSGAARRHSSSSSSSSSCLVLSRPSATLWPRARERKRFSWQGQVFLGSRTTVFRGSGSFTQTLGICPEGRPSSFATLILAESWFHPSTHHASPPHLPPLHITEEILADFEDYSPRQTSSVVVDVQRHPSNVFNARIRMTMPSESLECNAITMCNIKREDENMQIPNRSTDQTVRQKH